LMFGGKHYYKPQLDDDAEIVVIAAIAQFL
jgi:hypothetical protein